MLQISRITQDSRLRESVLSSWDSLLVLCRAISITIADREQSLGWLGSLRQDWLNIFGTEPVSEYLLQMNGELLELTQSGTSGDAAKREIFGKIVCSMDAICSDVQKHFEERLLPDYKAWFYLAINVDQLVRPVPSYPALTSLDLPTAESDLQQGLWELRPSAATLERRQQMDRMLSVLPARSPELDPCSLLVRSIYLDMARIGVSCLPESVLQAKTAEELAMAIEEVCLPKLMDQNGGRQETLLPAMPGVPPVTAESQIESPEMPQAETTLTAIPILPPVTVEPPSESLEKPQTGTSLLRASFVSLGYLEIRVNEDEQKVERVGFEQVTINSATEFRLLLTLAKARGRVPREQLECKWKGISGCDGTDRGRIDTAISKLKKLIKVLSLRIKNDPGLGWTLLDAKEIPEGT